MFFFRKSAEPADNAGDHEPADAATVVQQYPHTEDETTKPTDPSEAESDDVHYDENAPAAAESSSSSSEVEFQEDAEEEGEEAGEEAPHGQREGTVPPAQEAAMPSHPQHYAEEQESDDEGDAAAAAAANASAAPPPPTASPAHSGMHPLYQHHNHSRTPLAADAGTPTQASAVRRGGSRPTTPRHPSGSTPGILLSARSQSRGGQSIAVSAMSPSNADPELREVQYRRCASVVRSARNISDRRASSVNCILGNIDGGESAFQRRSGSMTAAEREAVERMMETEYRRFEAADRSSQYELIRESVIVEEELARERASYERRLQMEADRQAEIVRRIQQREERMAAAAQRRKEMEAKRQQAIFESVQEKETRYTMRDPYTVVAAQRRYQSPIAPQRRSSALAPSYSTSNNNSSAMQQRRNSTPISGRRSHSTKPPGVDMSRPRQCLPMDAWKTPQQLQQKQQRGSGSAPHRCLPPGAWQAATMADHPRQWH